MRMAFGLAEIARSAASGCLSQKVVDLGSDRDIRTSLLAVTGRIGTTTASEVGMQDMAFRMTGLALVHKEMPL